MTAPTILQKPVQSVCADGRISLATSINLKPCHKPWSVTCYSEFDPRLLLVLVAALPGTSNVSMLAENYSVDSGRIATITLLSTALSFVTFAAAVWLLGAAPAG